MADLEMPQRQTYPSIRGRVSDENGDPLPLATADELTLLLEVEGGDLFELPAVSLDPDDPGSAFTLNGVVIGANFEAPIGASGLSTDVVDLRGKLEIVWDALTTPPATQYAPQQGFISVSITENVQPGA